MSPKFESTIVLPDHEQSLNEKGQAKALCESFAVLGKMIAEGWIAVDMSQSDWHELYKLQLQTIAEVLYDYR